MPTPKRVDSGYPGVEYDAGTRKWIARLSALSRKGGSIGLYDSPGEAADARAAALKELAQRLNARPSVASPTPRSTHT